MSIAGKYISGFFQKTKCPMQKHRANHIHELLFNENRFLMRNVVDQFAYFIFSSFYRDLHYPEPPVQLTECIAPSGITALSPSPQSTPAA